MPDEGRLRDRRMGTVLVLAGNGPRILKRINLLIRDIMRDDSDGGIGKPERLRGDLSGFSSRRIDDEHRLVYRIDIEADSLLIAQCRYHYSDR